MVTKIRPHDKEQAVAFRKAARALGCDESEERFDATLAKVARHKPKPITQPQGHGDDEKETRR
jgi:hypothetical protein